MCVSRTTLTEKCLCVKLGIGQSIYFPVDVHDVFHKDVCL